ncbi:MAG: hypothetical protein LBT14_12760 [Treponema sp.]|nr:hypothetical protein [Treponema sp.]
MTWRFIGFILICSIFLIFISLNLENKCDISFGFTKLAGVHVWITAFVSFALGTFCTILFTLFARLKKKIRSKPGTQRKRSLKSKKKGDHEGDDTIGSDGD